MARRLAQLSTFAANRSPSFLLNAPQAALRAGSVVAARNMNLHEYQSVAVMRKFGVSTPPGEAASTVEEVEEIAQKMFDEGNQVVVKSQILAGGRGLGTFTNGFKGGVHVCHSVKDARRVAQNMLGGTLVTKQTGPEGKIVKKVLVAQKMSTLSEKYFAIVLDRETSGAILISSPKGGVNIEKVAKETPEYIFKRPVDLTKGPSEKDLKDVARGMGLSDPKLIDLAANEISKLWDLYTNTDATQVEINPMAETTEIPIMCMDAKLNFDSSAAFRQKEIFAMEDESQKDPRESEAEKHDLNYIGLDGNIGCMVNGAGLAMATMDIIKLYGGNPANFLDVGGGAEENQVVEAFKILNNDPRVECILVNIFGGIMRCDVIAQGIIRAASEVVLNVPLVVRLQGTNVEEARKLIEQSELRILAVPDLDDAASKAVKMAKIINIAREIGVEVSIEAPIE